MKNINGYKFANTTPHDIRVVDENDNIILHVEAAERPARAFQEMQEHARVAGIPLMRFKFKMIGDLPGPESRTLHIVDMTVAQAAQAAGRPVYDLIIPDAGPDCIRRDGHVWAVRRFLTI